MNKQDKIKKVMREFKDGKLKTPNGEVVTDKKQALAIAMSESEDYTEKADLIEDISIRNLSHAEDVIKSIGSEELFEKAKYQIGDSHPNLMAKEMEQALKDRKKNTKVKKAIDDEIGISDAYRELFGEDLEKAHQDGDIHPKHPDWVWVSSASGGKGDWRKAGGRAHKKHQETNGKKGNEQSQTKTIADHASETKTETLQKVVNSNASTQLKQAAKKELKKREDSRKKSIKGKKKQSSTTQNAHVEKLIDFYKISSSRYTDTSKMSIVITPKGNWNLRYDGKDVSTISGHIMDRKTLENAGIKFEDIKKRPVGAGTNGPTPKTKADKKVDDKSQSDKIDTDTYNKMYKIAMSKEETTQHLKKSLQKIKDGIKEVKDSMLSNEVSSATLGKFQKMLISLISKQRAIEDALKKR